MKKPIVSENTLESKLALYLSKHFHVYRQQWSVCMKKRIDIVIVHKTEDWFKLGIEVKNNGLKHGKDLAAWCTQASNYNNYIFCNKQEGFEYGRMPILVCPPISGELIEYSDPNGYRHGKYDSHHNINSFLFGAFTIGEIRKHKPNNRGELLHFSANNRTLWKEFNFNTDHTFSQPNLSAYEDTMKAIEKRFPL